MKKNTAAVAALAPIFAVAALAACIAPAHAAQVADFSPQGETRQIDSVQARFTDPMAPFGDAGWPAPFELDCSGGDADGSARWLDSQRWTYVFDAPLPANTQCTATLVDDVRTLHNERLAGPTSFTFETGAPRVVTSRPWGSEIDEDQIFVLRFNGDPGDDAWLADSQCKVEGLGEAVPVIPITGQQRKAILELLDDTALEPSDWTRLVQCQRRLPPGARVELHVGPDVLRYQVRDAFTATLTCQRENARADCLPVSHLGLRFSTPIVWRDAAQIRLKTQDGPAEGLEPVRSPDDADDALAYSVRFASPFPPESDLAIHIPSDLTDDAGRSLVNGDDFPLTFRTAAYPPLVKFASGTFGVIERFAAVAPDATQDDHPPTVPLILRDVELDLMTQSVHVSAGRMDDLVLRDDREALRWIARLDRLQQGRWTRGQIEAILADQPIDYNDQGSRVDSRSIRVLDQAPGSRRIDLPGAGMSGWRPSEVIGVPVPEPGLHVLEVTSPRLGQSLLESGAPMAVRTLALVTNLGVHLKLGQDDALVWVTALDDGQVVQGADVRVLDCEGRPLARGVTDAQGVWHHRQPLDAPDYCSRTGLTGVFVSARIDADHPQARGKADYSFVLSEWDDGIEPWRFNVPVQWRPYPERQVHTVTDRSLFQVGETVGMKHFFRSLTRDGLSIDAHGRLPETLIVDHQGSDYRATMPVTWRRTPTGGLSAHNDFVIPRSAPPGTYQIRMTDADHNDYGTTEFRVQEFRLPVFTGSLTLDDHGQDAVLIAPDTVTADIQVNYLDGGPARDLPVVLSAMSEPLRLAFPGYEDFSFEPPTSREEGGTSSGHETTRHVFLTRHPVTLDAHGAARPLLDGVPRDVHARRWTVEAEFADPGGTVQTLTRSQPVWPAALQAGIHADGWGSAGEPVTVRMVALQPDGQPRAGVPMRLEAATRLTWSTRTRVVGGFYHYDNHVETRSLGTLCEGETGDDGILECQVTPTQTGALELTATAQDDQARQSRAATTAWVSGDTDLWFGGHDDDRIDVVADRTDYQPGDVAEFQVRMPFERATALVTVEREGVLHQEALQLHRSDPIFRLPIQADWGPNAYVSVLLVRGRLRTLPWRSLDASLWRSPLAVAAHLDHLVRLRQGPTSRVDLAKPSFRMGLASVRVVNRNNQLDVTVTPERSRYDTGDTAWVDVRVTRADGKPAAGGTIAFAAVDQALLELSPNTSIHPLEAFGQPRHYGVQTATAQMQIVGRRHYGRKALPPGGGGGHMPTRRLLDTLLLWEPEVALDDQGHARIAVPLNDALTRFRLVAVADHGPDAFGTGEAEIHSVRDLQLISGIPSTVRQGDRYQAHLTVRNTTDRAMQVDVSAMNDRDAADRQHWTGVTLGAGEARKLAWSCDVSSAGEPAMALRSATWRLSAKEQASQDADDEVVDGQDSNGPVSDGRGARDALQIVQKIVPAAPVEVQQTALNVLEPDRTVDLPVMAPPQGAVRDANGAFIGGLQIQAAPGPLASLANLDRWFAQDGGQSLEFRASRAIATQDGALWAEVMADLPGHLDEDGLAAYFSGGARGNESLTAWLLIISDEAERLQGQYRIPRESRDAMLAGLRQFVQGRIERNRWAPFDDLAPRKLLALDALSRYESVPARLLDSVKEDADAWPTMSLISWLNVLRRMPGPEQDAKAQTRAENALAARMLERGSTRVFTEDTLNESAWLMATRPANQAMLLMAARDGRDGIEQERRLAQGLIGMQRRGQWGSSLANALAAVALQGVAHRQGASPASGRLYVRDANGAVLGTLDLDGDNQANVLIPWARLTPASSSVAASEPARASLQLTYEGSGSPWIMASALAAVVPDKPVNAGVALTRGVRSQPDARGGHRGVGDLLRVRMTLELRAPMTWVRLKDALPAGATVLGDGLARDSRIALTIGDSSARDPVRQPDFSGQDDGFWSAWFDYLPGGRTQVEYVMRLNTAGVFHLPATRAQAVYEPDVYGELPWPEPIAVNDTPADADDGAAAGPDRALVSGVSADSGYVPEPNLRPDSGRMSGRGAVSSHGAPPSYETVRQRAQPSSVQVLDRNGRLLQRMRQDFTVRRGDWVPLSAMSPALVRAVIHAEDRRFAQHGGVDWHAIASAAWHALRGGQARGASTLTMQLAGFLSADLPAPGRRSVTDKLTQLGRARTLESQWSKDQILEAYLNLAAFRGELSGIDALSRVLFRKAPSGLDLREAALSAAMLRSPNATPLSLQQHTCRLLTDLGRPDECVALPAFIHAALSNSRQRWSGAPELAPHFARLAWRAAQEGPEEHSVARPVMTTLDAGLQSMAGDALRGHVRALAPANVGDAAVVVVDNATGDVLAYVGSSGALSAAPQVDHARALRQAGSTLKPFLYAQALQEGRLTTSSWLDNGPLSVATGAGLYIPQNYDRQSSGWVTTRTALASSLNLPAVRVLGMVGPASFARTLVRLGLPLDRRADFYGNSLALGSADVSLLTLVNAYRTLANHGRHSPLNVLAGGSPAAGTQVLDARAAWQVGDMLSDRQARAMGFGLDNPLAMPFWTAVKTGTSKDMRDNWAVGWSDAYTVGVWVGNTTGASMHDVSGVSGAGPIWHDMMRALHRSRAGTAPLAPPDVAGQARMLGTEPADTAMRPAALPSGGGPAGIVAPVDGTVVALDPDIPERHQRLLLQASGTPPDGASWEWRLNGKMLGSGNRASWAPVPGRHHVELVGINGIVVDRITVIVTSSDHDA